MNPLLFRIRAWWESADRGQRAITLGGAVFMGLLLLGTFYFASRPKFALLYSGISESEKATVVAAIQSMPVPVNYDTPGMVEVPENRLEEVRMKLSTQGKEPKSGHIGVEGIDKIGLATTPAVEKERLKIVLQDSCAKSIESLDSIESAQVLITLGDTSPLFVEQRKPPTASVVVSERSGKRVSMEQARAIASVVSRAVDGLDSKDITVVNQAFELLFNGKDSDNAKTQAQTKLDLEDQVARRKERELQQVLDTAFGPGSTVVRVHCDLDLNEQSSKATLQKPSDDPYEKQKTVEKMSGDTGKIPGGSAGAVANIGVSNPVDLKAKVSDWEQSHLVENHLVNTTETSEKKAAGSLKAMVINVVANSTRILDMDGLKKVVAGEVLDHSDEATKFTTNVTPIAFDTASSKDAATAATASASQARTQQIMSMLPIVAMLIVAVMVVRQIGKLGGNGPAAPQAALSSGMSLPVNLASLSPAEQVAARSLLASIEAEGGSVTGPDGTKHGILMGAGPDDDAVIVNSIKDRVLVPLEQLKKMAAERPATVATLVKSMLLEENR